MKESTLKTKLKNIVGTVKPKTFKVNGKNVYITKKMIDNCKKEGGILPLLPLIFGGISAIAAAAGGTAGIVKAVHEKKASDAEYEEQKRHNLEI